MIFKFAHELIVKVVFVKTVAEPYQRCVVRASSDVFVALVEHRAEFLEVYDFAYVS